MKGKGCVGQSTVYGQAKTVTLVNKFSKHCVGTWSLQRVKEDDI